jgi:hypothetical protein
MQNAAKKQNATLAAAFLFASLIITPLSLKALGVSLNFSAGVEAWRRIAGTIADNYQPANTAQLIARSFATEDSESDETTPAISPLLASTQPLDMQLTAEPGLRIGDQVWDSEPVASPAPACPQSMKRAPRVFAKASKATVAIAPFVQMDTQTQARTETAKALVIRKEALQEVKRALESKPALATYHFNFEQVQKLLPKDFKFTVKVKPPAPPAITGCAQRRALTPEQVKLLRAAAWSLTFNTAAESSDNSEL